MRRTFRKYRRYWLSGLVMLFSIVVTLWWTGATPAELWQGLRYQDEVKELLQQREELAQRVEVRNLELIEWQDDVEQREVTTENIPQLKKLYSQIIDNAASNEADMERILSLDQRIKEQAVMETEEEIVIIYKIDQEINQLQITTQKLYRQQEQYLQHRQWWGDSVGCLNQLVYDDQRAELLATEMEECLASAYLLQEELGRLDSQDVMLSDFNQWVSQQESLQKAYTARTAGDQAEATRQLQRYKELTAKVQQVDFSDKWEQWREHLTADYKQQIEEINQRVAEYEAELSEEK